MCLTPEEKPNPAAAKAESGDYGYFTFCYILYKESIQNERSP